MGGLDRNATLRRSPQCNLHATACEEQRLKVVTEMGSFLYLKTCGMQNLYCMNNIFFLNLPLNSQNHFLTKMHAMANTKPGNGTLRRIAHAMWPSTMRCVRVTGCGAVSFFFRAMWYLKLLYNIKKWLPAKHGKPQLSWHKNQDAADHIFSKQSLYFQIVYFGKSCRHYGKMLFKPARPFHQWCLRSLNSKHRQLPVPAKRMRALHSARGKRQPWIHVPPKTMAKTVCLVKIWASTRVYMYIYIFIRKHAEWFVHIQIYDEEIYLFEYQPCYFIMFFCFRGFQQTFGETSCCHHLWATWFLLETLSVSRDHDPPNKMKYCYFTTRSFRYSPEIMLFLNLDCILHCHPVCLFQVYIPEFTKLRLLKKNEGCSYPGCFPQNTKKIMMENGWT